jgi:hypothetical protein
MAIIIANENGDWWALGEEDAKIRITNLYILDTSKITDEAVLTELADWAGIELEDDDNGYIIPEDIHKQIDENIFNSDKLERLAWEYGEIKGVKF